MKRFLLPLVFVLTSGFLKAQHAAIIPQPVNLQLTGGNFTIDQQTGFLFDKTNPDLAAAASLFALQVKQVSGISLQAGSAKKLISFKLAKLAEIGNEGYLLSVTSKAIVLSANTKAGILNGIQSLLQTLPAIRTNAPLQVPCMQVKDYPQFAWRGMHLDVSRHFFSPEFVKEYIDLLARYKFNTFHWHLVDDPGWRIEIKKYPKLTQVGAWRVDHNDKEWGERPQAKPGETPTYGGFYTQQQIREIVAYAAARNVTIVPEIEMPGHVASAIASYPNLTCTQTPQLMLTGGNYSNISSNYCAGNDSVFAFIKDVFDEVLALFPSAYIHVGGDELDKTNWKKCARCQQRIKTEGLQNEEELQSYFMKRVERMLVAKGRKMIGWDEILDGGLAPEAAVMSWRGEAGGIQAANMHHYVVMTPGKPLYFDNYQADPATEPVAIGGFNTLKNVYDYQPVPKELSDTAARYVLGAQANLWTEFISTPSHAEYMVLPRMLALSEVLWSNKQSRDWTGFYNRLQQHFNVFDQLGLRYSKGNYRVDMVPVANAGKLSVALVNEQPGSAIRYTTNGEEPTLSSQVYNTPVPVDSSLTLKAVTVINGKPAGTAVSQRFDMHKAVGFAVQYEHEPSSAYPANGNTALTDGIRGGLMHGKFWQGFNNDDLIATIDLGKPTSIHSLSLGCLQRYKDWIFLPSQVVFETSDDGIHFTTVKVLNNADNLYEKEPLIKNFSAGFPALQTRFIRVKAVVLNSIPQGHPGAGSRAWLFADELVVE